MVSSETTHLGNTFNHIVNMRTNGTDNGIFLVGTEPFFDNDQILLWHRDINTGMTKTSDEFTTFAADLNNTAFYRHFN